ncbi:hypothetical protein SAMN05443247_10388 [Bradyrhizobium erythrophlei]|jgi:hypothetical protein|nr:hypothetical protein SAMN05443247_10388 [Bradyrhizobium erythrophlei]
MGAGAGDTRSFGVGTLVGIGVHMALSAAYRIATVYRARQLDIAFVYAGVAVRIVFWLFNHFLIGSATAGARKHVEFDPAWLACGLHALYGAVTGLVAISPVR